MTADIVELATRYGRYGYRRITALLREAGWVVNFKRVERIWRREGLKVPHKQPKRGRLWLNDGSCIRLQARVSKPCLVLRLRRRSHSQWAEISHAEHHRRVHAGILRCVDRCWPRTRHANRSETPNVSMARSTQMRRRAGLTSFPKRPLLGSVSQASDPTPPCANAHSPSRAP